MDMYLEQKLAILGYNYCVYYICFKACRGVAGVVSIVPFRSPRTGAALNFKIDCICIFID